jgi:predicted nucleic acid-binding protein
MPLLVDTGVIYALADRRDAWHRRVHEYLSSHRDTLLAPVTILPEVANLLRERIGPAAERAFLTSLARRELAVENLVHGDVERAVDLMASSDAIGLVDATIIAVAERLKATKIATTDRRHFSAVRPSHVERFTLVP